MLFDLTSFHSELSEFLVRSLKKSCLLPCLLFVAAAFAFGGEVVADNKPDANKARKQVDKAMQRGDYPQAEILLQELLRDEPENYVYRLALGFSYYKQRKLVESYDEAMRIAPKNPNDSRVRSLVGAVLLQAGRIEEARQILQAAQTMNPDDALAVGSLAMIDYYENQSKKALAKLRRAAYLQPNEPDFVFALAQIAARLESYKEAADAYERFLRVAPHTDTDRRDRIIGLIAFLKYLGNIKSLYEAGGARATVIACETVNNRPVVEVRVNNNEKPLRFVLDTGSGMTVLSNEAAESLNIKPVVRGGMARAVGGAGKFPIVYGFLDSLEIGDARIERVPIYIREFQKNADKFDGYLGLSVISKFLTTLDYRAKTFALVRTIEKDRNKAKINQMQPPSELVDGAFSVPLRTTTSGFLSSTVKLEGVEEPLNFIFDTGASISVVSMQAAKRVEISRHIQPAMLRVFGAAGVAENVSTLLLPRLNFGGVTREKIQAAVLDLDPVNEATGFEQAGIIGGNFLQHYRLTLDLQNSVVTFEPSKSATAVIK